MFIGVMRIPYRYSVPVNVQKANFALLLLGK